MRKREKRKRKKLDRGIIDFMMVANHFFHPLREWILEMEDPRNQRYTTYAQVDLGYIAILKNVCDQDSMREMEENFNKETCIDTAVRNKFEGVKNSVSMGGESFLERVRYVFWGCRFLDFPAIDCSSYLVQ